MDLCKSIDYIKRHCLIYTFMILIVQLLVIIKNNKRCTVHVLKLKYITL